MSIKQRKDVAVARVGRKIRDRDKLKGSHRRIMSDKCAKSRLSRKERACAKERDRDEN